jgi:hypothetical protein
MRKYENPTVTTERGAGGTEETIERHPAFAQIGASRVQGLANLYGSDFRHHGFVEITIRESEQRRSLSSDWHFARRDYIRVALSEAQWATFVSSLNCGQGVPCTLERMGNESVPSIPDRPVRSDQFTREMAADVREAVEAIEALDTAIAALPLSAKRREELRAQASRARRALTSSVPFVAQSFAEHVETVTEHARIEINAHVQATLARAGLASLTGAAAVPFELPAAGGEEER